ncbi:hypothetical protein GRI44_02530 [Altererythrobacter confluentis]|uniref:Uncharacterized protein n=1 Tax=Allopontixanthobacter confluentis TaxID=1849021 RepID=A0A6L7GCE1_9SPHN|nr:hypothetical protein [Allopontixanthobacter confluentis]MXP13629.1 hypothetical protein [Allopontixanthobacter confluentis]
MTKSLLDNALMIKKLIRETEAVLDEATELGARLKQAMVQARQHPDVPVASGQSALLRLAEVERHVLQASSQIFRVHSELSTLAPEVGILDEYVPTVTKPGAFQLPEERIAA